MGVCGAGPSPDYTLSPCVWCPVAPVQLIDGIVLLQSLDSTIRTALLRAMRPAFYVRHWVFVYGNGNVWATLRLAAGSCCKRDGAEDSLIARVRCVCVCRVCALLNPRNVVRQRHYMHGGFPGAGNAVLAHWECNRKRCHLPYRRWWACIRTVTPRHGRTLARGHPTGSLGDAFALCLVLHPPFGSPNTWVCVC